MASARRNQTATPRPVVSNMDTAFVQIGTAGTDRLAANAPSISDRAASHYETFVGDNATENEVAIAPFTFDGTSIRIIVIDGEPWFVGMEIASMLGYSDTFEMTKRLDSDEKQNRQIAGFGPRGITLINEPGLYTAILGSQKAEAKTFKKWITAEVLPTIRRTGSYVTAPAVPTLPQNYAEALRALASEVESKATIAAERDHAIATKAQIGSQREASAMATASAAVREANRLKAQLGRSQTHATVLAVERASRRSFGPQGWRLLRKWCDDHGLTPESVHDPRYGTVKAWPADAWGSVYSIDLSELFPASE